jgi:hypothetical protein
LKIRASCRFKAFVFGRNFLDGEKLLKKVDNSDLPFGTELLYQPTARTVAVTVKGQIRVLGPFADEAEALDAGKAFANEAVSYPLRR